MAKKFSELSAEEKAKRYAYNKAYRNKIRSAAIAGGYAPTVRVSLSPEERSERRKGYNKAYRQRMREAYQYFRNMGLSPTEAAAEVEQAVSEQYIPSDPTPSSIRKMYFG
jgi:hypothetical protein